MSKGIRETSLSATVDLPCKKDIDLLRHFLSKSRGDGPTPWKTTNVRPIHVMDTTKVVEESNDFGPQAIAVVASVTAGISSVVATQLTKRFPLSFHASSPRWKYTVFSVIIFSLVYIGLLLYGMLQKPSQSSLLAFMAAPSVSLHGFLWALIPQTRYAANPPSTDAYFRQCFVRKPTVLLILTWAPLVLGVVLAGLKRAWQGLAVQIATSATFLATGSTPEMITSAKQNSFGLAGRFVLLPRPGLRDTTIGYTIDLEEERLLDPVQLSMSGIQPYRIVSEQKNGRARPVPDDENTSELPVVVYLDTFVENFPLDRLSFMATSMWKTLENFKNRLTEPVMDIFLLYGLFERAAYVAYRPSVCTLGERRSLAMVSYSVCIHDCERSGSDFQTMAVELRNQWREKGVQLIGSDAWENCRTLIHNPVDKEIPAADDLLGEADQELGEGFRVVLTIGAVVHFFEHVLGHDESIMSAIINKLPFYHNRISRNVGKQGANIPLTCRNILSSMKSNQFLDLHVDGHQWASSGEPLRWGGAGYALLDQAYARNSAVAYVAQLAIIVIKAVLEN